mmetsp:Transcript_29458/g.64541  ORF Transcript_29458/g.64541 Transcript_29458/m.64541 type:complete len:215 (-) Transcript_29458:689-1333(-)
MCHARPICPTPLTATRRATCIASQGMPRTLRACLHAPRPAPPRARDGFVHLTLPRRAASSAVFILSVCLDQAATSLAARVPMPISERSDCARQPRAKFISATSSNASSAVDPTVRSHPMQTRATAGNALLQVQAVASFCLSLTVKPTVVPSSRATFPNAKCVAVWAVRSRLTHFRALHAAAAKAVPICTTLYSSVRERVAHRVFRLLERYPPYR